MFPSLFLSHGAPTLALETESPTHRFLASLGHRIGRPKAILMASAHWETLRPAVATTDRPATIHDFGGFPRALFEMTYPAPGAPEIAESVAELLEKEGIAVDRDFRRGLDHGAWVPLRLMYPEADIPVFQLSIQPQADPRHHFEIGQRLAPLREKGVLVIGSGSSVHNLRRVRFNSDDIADWAIRFDDWVVEKATAGDVASLLDYRRSAPDAELAHPTDEHFLPLFVALGAGGQLPKTEVLHRHFAHGSLGHTAFAF